LEQKVTVFTDAEIASCRHLVELALAEDLGTIGDLSSQLTIPADTKGQALFVAREAGVLSGMPVAEIVCSMVDPRITFEPFVPDGSFLKPGDHLAEVAGPMRGILAVERTALNFLQRLCGVASMTRRFVDAVAGLPTKILDTRKTTPGYRLLEKYAVRCGGGHNHRMGLYDGILIKDNHLAALGSGLGAITLALEKARTLAIEDRMIEIEVDTLDQYDVARNCKPGIILLDNMSLDQMREAVRRRNASGAGILLEASGGVKLATVRDIAETGVDHISVGALTHSAPALDLALDYRA
jgi:nicotinate-nucleotide pyrophosphorylase (carboxylating)